MPGPGARRRRALSALLCCHAAAAFLGARPVTTPRAHRAEANDDGDDDAGDDAVIGLDSLPDELQSQIVEAIARSRLRDGKAEGVISTNEDGAASLFLFGNEDEEVTLEKTDSDEDDDDDQPFVVLGDRKRKQKKAKDLSLIHI